jgi:1,4-dihydroxy-6-naphthoate synthase
MPLTNMREEESIMKQILKLGYSPCPNDTYIFFALSEGRIDLDSYQVDTILADVEVLNHKTHQGALDVVKVSIHALLHLLDQYCLLRSGGALGKGCGPLLVARQPLPVEEIRHKTIAIPGKWTTAHLLLQLHGGHEGHRQEMIFHEIMPAVARGEVDAGLIIHEGRFTYPAMGLHKILDLGDWWEKQTGLPLPLGGIVIKRSLGPDTARFMEAKIRESLLYARAHPQEVWSFVQSYAQEMEPAVIQQHIDTFVNEFSLDMGLEGQKAIERLLEAASQQTGESLPEQTFFVD